MTDQFPILFPLTRSHRGGIGFDVPTDAQRLIREQMTAITRRVVEKSALYRHFAIEAAVRYATIHRFDVHIYEPPVPFSVHTATATDEVLYRLRYVGIEFTPATYGVPTLTIHPCKGDDFDWEMAWEDADLQHWIR